MSPPPASTRSPASPCGSPSRALRHEGITVVLTTHYMEEADELCDRVAIIDNGKILVEDTPTALKAPSAPAPSTSSPSAKAPTPSASTSAMPGVTAVEPTPRASASSPPASATASSPTRHHRRNNGLLDLSIAEPTLETVFIRMTGRELRE